MKSLSFKLLILLFSNLLMCQEKVSSKIMQADSLIISEQYELSLHRWSDVVTQISKSDKNYKLYESKLFFCEAKLAQEGRDYAKAIEKYSEVLQIIDRTRNTIKFNVSYVVDVYNGLYHSLAYAGNWDEALTTGNEGLDLFDNSIDIETRANYIYDLGYINDKLQNYNEAIKLYHESISLYEELEESKNFDIGLAYNNLGTCYGQIGFFTNRLNSLENAKAYWEETKDISPSYLLTIYGNLMKLYIEYGDLKKATDLHGSVNSLKSNQLSISNIASQHRLNVIYYTFAAKTHEAEKQIASLGNYFSKLSASDKRNNSHHFLAALIDLGGHYYDEYLYDEATAILDRAIALSLKHNQPYYRMLGYTEKTKIAVDKERFNEAVQFLNKAEEVKEMVNIKDVNLLNILIKKASLQAKMSHLDEAYTTIKEAFAVLVKNNINSPKEITPAIFEKQHSSFFIIALRNAADVYKEIYYKSGTKEDALNAKYLYELSAIVFSKYYQNGEYNTSLNHLNKSINEGILEFHSKLEIPFSEETLVLIESNNSQVLRNEFEKKYIQSLNNSEETILKRNLLEFELEQLAKSEQNNNKKEELKNSIDLLDSEIIAKDPLYFSFLNEKITLENIQQGLRPEELLIKYTIGTHRIYAITISKDELLLYDLGNKDEVKDHVEELYDILQNPMKDTNYYSKLVFGHLLDPLKDQIKNYHTLTIIPDNFLHYLPFETLTDENKLLVDTHKVKYAYSLSLWNLIKDTKPLPDKNKKMLVAFAPEYAYSEANEASNRGNRFEAIDGARNEAKEIASLVSGDLYLNDEVSIENFVKTSTLYRIYHLAMHASLNVKDNREANLIFQNDQFFGLSELYKLSFPAELVVLSACSTGIGDLAAGEGLLSLSRALTYSGVRSSVYSLWEVPDEETSELMISFYKYLSDGKKKDEALTLAKNDFIRNNPMKNHPYYWGGFVINGDVSPIKTEKLTPVWWYGIGGGLLIIGLIFFFLRRFKKTS